MYEVLVVLNLGYCIKVNVLDEEWFILIDYF